MAEHPSEITPQESRPNEGPEDRSIASEKQTRHSENKLAADAELMASVAAGDQQAIELFYDRFAPLVYRIAGQSLPKADAEDAVQDIFVRLWRTADRYDRDRAALVTWVMLITRRHVVDRLRRAKARINTVSAETDAAWSPYEGGQPDRGMEVDESFRELLKRIQTLPDLQRLVVLRAYLGGQTLRQISEETDTPIGTIKSALSRALVRLRERVPDRGS